MLFMETVSFGDKRKFEMCVCHHINKPFKQIEIKRVSTCFKLMINN